MTYLILNLLYVLYISLVQIPGHTGAECSHYYTILTREQFSTPGTTWKGFITPKQLSGQSLDNQYNTTEVYNIIQKNYDCILDIECVEGTLTSCDELTEVGSQLSTHEFIDTSYVKANLSNVISENTPSILQVVASDKNQTESTIEPEKRRDGSTEITPAISSVTPIEASTEITTIPPTATSIAPEDTTINNIMTSGENAESSPNTTIEPTENPPIIMTESTVNSTPSITITDSGHLQSPDDEKYESLKYAAIAVASLGSGAILIFLTSKIPGVLQSATYRLPDPTIAESGV